MRLAKEVERLRREEQQLTQKVAQRAGSLVRQFEKIRAVLTTLGYLDQEAGVTSAGAVLAELYLERDLLLAQLLRAGTRDGATSDELAALVAALVYEGRSDEAGSIPVRPRHLAELLTKTNAAHRQLLEVEARHSRGHEDRLDYALSVPLYRWAQGSSLDEVLAMVEVAPGDFVRWCRQVIDVLGQISFAAPQARLREAAEAAVQKVRRGIVLAGAA